MPPKRKPKQKLFEKDNQGKFKNHFSCFSRIRMFFFFETQKDPNQQKLGVKIARKTQTEMNMENTYYILKDDLVTKCRHFGTQTESTTVFDEEAIRKLDKKTNETENLKASEKENAFKLKL